ncbi:hypothetical protein [Nitrosomonas sp. ANs5]|uniref:hypothetical protein n=1 Tax=Nitrosomonas sp. ANs5 TaxID=3423941 RepID=UPI003D356FB3
MTKSYLGPVLLIFAGLLLSACVTINIYFPAAAAEKVADKIIEEVWQIEEPAVTEGEAGEHTTPQ